MLDHKYFCPSCGEEKLPDLMIPKEARKFQMHLPYFMCSNCRLIYLDRQLIRDIISEWRNSDSSRKSVPYRKVCQEILGYLETTVENYCRTASYKRAKFRKVIR